MTLQYLAPLCIASSIRRSGTTLVQRLLCAATDTLIYGESCANDLNILASLLSTKQLMYSHGMRWRDEQLARVLDGQVNEWIPDLMPPTASYLDLYRQSLYRMSDSLAAYATQQGRRVWGVKMAQWNPAQLLQLKQLLPGTKVIYLHRELGDCVRSAKRMDMVVELPEVRQFAQQWQRGNDYARQYLTGPAVLHIDYEALVAEPHTWLPRLAEFAGSKPLDATVLEARINTDTQDPRLAQSEHAFLVPATLTVEEQEIVAVYSEASSTA